MSKAFIGVMLYLNEAPLPVYHFSLLHLSSLPQNLIEGALTKSQWSERQCEACRCVCVNIVSVCIKQTSCVSIELAEKAVK